MKNLTLMATFIALFVFLASTAKAFQFVPAFPGTTFNRPVFLTSARDNSGRIFVVEQAGTIKSFQQNNPAATLKTYLDVSTLLDAGWGEEGLLGLAFEPDFAITKKFYVYYIGESPMRTVVARYTEDPIPGIAVPDSAQIILEQIQPYSNHNGGMIAFGPDRMLYIGLGDGGSGGDPHGYGQSLVTFLGKMLRIDVIDKTGYEIPADNPFVGRSDSAKKEIFAYGLRNPWRWSFDRVTGNLWAGDVGQNTYEEINLIEKGYNYGWNFCEGFHSTDDDGDCTLAGAKPPVYEYDHMTGQSITGGYVYHGLSAPSLNGKYLFADYVQSKVFALDIETGSYDALSIGTAPQNVSSFGEDESGEVYVVGYRGTIFKITD